MVCSRYHGLEMRSQRGLDYSFFSLIHSQPFTAQHRVLIVAHTRLHLEEKRGGEKKGGVVESVVRQVWGPYSKPYLWS